MPTDDSAVYRAFDFTKRSTVVISIIFTFESAKFSANLGAFVSAISDAQQSTFFVAD